MIGEFFEPITGPLSKIAVTLAVGVALLTGGYYHGKTVTTQRYELAAAQKKIIDLTVIDLAAQADAEKRAEQDRTIEALRKEIADARPQIKQGSNTCFDAGDVDQLRKFWKP